MTDGTMTKDSEPIALGEIEIDAGVIATLMHDTFTRALAELFRTDPPWLTLSFDEEDQDDPLGMLLILPLGESEEGVRFAFDLRDLVTSFVDGQCCYDDKLVEDFNAAECRELSAALRELADQIDARIKPKDA